MKTIRTIAIVCVLGAATANAVLAAESTPQEIAPPKKVERSLSLDLPVGWDSLLMFRGVNVIRTGDGYGSGVFWVDPTLVWNPGPADHLTFQAYDSRDSENGSYKEFDFLANYAHDFGSLSSGIGYKFYYIYGGTPNLTSHEINANIAYNVDLGFMKVTPALTYNINAGPAGSDKGIAPRGASYLEARVGGNISVCGGNVSLTPWVSVGQSLNYDARLIASGRTENFDGISDVQLGLGARVKITPSISVYGYAAYSHALERLVHTARDTGWAGAKVAYSF